MLTYLQQSKFNKNTFATTNNPQNASHFQRDGGPILAISELNDQEEVEPLELVTMGFDDEENSNEITGEVQPLDLPSVF